ncbi:MAG: zf-HC2 domain-containing protein [Acidimicrobiales bacterium]
MTPLRCSELRDVAPDVALGILTGEERAHALAHLEGCAACRAEVASLAGVADELLLTGPEATPPEGFDRRVLARLTKVRAAEAPSAARSGGPAHLHRRARRRRPDRRRLAVGAALAAAAAAVVLVAAVLVTSDDPPSSTAERAEMTTGVGEVVGTATVRSGNPATVAVDVPGWEEAVPAGATYWLAIELDDGSRTMTHIGTDATWWQVPLEGDADEVATVSVLDGDGWVWCSAEFSA